MTVAVVGHAWRTPLGHSLESVLPRLLAGQRAASPNSRFDAKTYACTLAATISTDPAPSRHQRFLRRMGLFALEVAAEALTHAQLHGNNRTGLFFGYGGLRAHWNDMMPALEQQNSAGNELWENGFKLFHPFWMLQHLSNNAHALAAMDLSARGEGATFGGGNAGAQALCSAIRALQIECIDTALVVAYDTLIEPETLVGLAARGSATTRSITELASPYDQQASGFVPGEAAAAIVLQRRKDNHQPPLAYIEATNGADGETGEPHTATLMKITHPLIQGHEVIDGAGRAQITQDMEERMLIAKQLGNQTPLCCIMSAMGHVGAAAPLVQAIALAGLLKQTILPPIAGLSTIPEGPLRPLQKAENTAARSALALSTAAPGLAGAIRIELPDTH